MLKYLKRKRDESTSEPINDPAPAIDEITEQSSAFFNIDDVISDPGKRKPIESFEIAVRDRIRREYIIRGPCQPVGHDYKPRKFGNRNRYFQECWYKDFEWLEYSKSLDAAFCFYCYLFKNSNKGVGKSEDDTFTKT